MAILQPADPGKPAAAGQKKQMYQQPEIQGRKFCSNAEQCGNGSGRTQHPAEMLGDDWYTYGDWGFEPDIVPSPGGDSQAETQDKA